jgi:biotin transport system substrate-specific component
MNQTLSAAAPPKAGLALDVRQLPLPWKLGMVLLGSLALVISAKVQVPFYPVPMTLQTLVVLLIGAFYGWRLGAATVILYLAQGFAGFPVFANTPPAVAGPLYFVGPTAGFLIGFIVSAIAAGWAVERFGARNTVAVFGAMLAGQIALFALGTVWLAFFAQLASGATGIGLGRAVNAAVLPFALADLVKTVIAALVVRAAVAR